MLVTTPRRAIVPAVTLALLGLMLCGCAGAGGDRASLMTSALPAGKGRVVLERTNETLHAATPASTSINGSKVADVAPGARQVVDVAPGPAKLTVEAWSYPGSYTIPLDVRAGETLRIEIAPRPATGPSVVLGPIGGLVDKDDNGNGGAFTARQVANLDAKPGTPPGREPPSATP
jgi:hypothetical protein